MGGGAVQQTQSLESEIFDSAPSCVTLGNILEAPFQSPRI